MKLVKVTAVWCMSCILMNERLKKIEDENATNYDTIDYDFDTDSQELEQYNIGTILPVYILFDSNSNEIARSVGENSKKELNDFFSSNGGINEN